LRIAINLLLFQLAWFSCVLLRSWFAIGIVAAVVVVHILLTDRRRAELLFIGILTLLGTLLDSVLMQAGMFVFERSDMWPEALGSRLSFLCPVWLIGIWIAFATTIGSTQSLLSGRQWLAPCMGAIAAPLAYFAGMRLGAMQFGWSNVTSLVVLAIVWALAIPSILALYRVVVDEQIRE